MMTDGVERQMKGGQSDEKLWTSCSEWVDDNVKDTVDRWDSWMAQTTRGVYPAVCEVELWMMKINNTNGVLNAPAAAELTITLRVGRLVILSQLFDIALITL